MQTIIIAADSHVYASRLINSRSQRNPPSCVFAFLSNLKLHVKHILKMRLLYEIRHPLMTIQLKADTV